MKRFLSTSFIVLALVISTAPAAHAQYALPGDDPGINSETGTSASTPGTTNAINPQANGAVTDPVAANTPNNGKLGPTTPPEYTFNGVMSYVAQLFAWLLGVAAITLDNAVYYTVVKMGSYVNSLSAVGVTWRIMRDIGNIVIIFGFLAAGIATIINVDMYGWGKKMLPTLLVAAVFLNFSLFLSEAVIDTGNLFATQFYTQINGDNPAGAKSITSFSGINQEGISNKLMSSLGLQTIYGEAISPGSAADLFKNSWSIGFMSIILFLIAAFVMFSLAFILITRFVILLFLIIVAPIGFAGLAVPKLESTAKKWWGALFEQTITAPVLLLLLYIALAVITDASFLTGFSDCVAGSTGATGCSNPSYIGYVDGNFKGFASVILSFLVAMGLLLAVVIISKKMSAFGGGMATSLAGKLSFGATAFVGRRTVGRLSNYTARKIRSSGFGRSDMGKLFAGVADRGAKASFDIRGATIAGGLKALKIDAGDAQKGGYHAREEELMKSRIDYAKTLRQTGKERTTAEQANIAKDKLIDTHNIEMEKLEKEEQEQLKKVRDATNKEDKEAEKEKVDEIRNRIGLEKNSHKTAISEQDIIIKKNSPAAAQKEYGEALRKKTVFGVIPRFPYDWPTAVGSARREASSRIIGEANKDASLKKLDEIENMLARQSKAGPASAASTPSTPATPAP